MRTTDEGRIEIDGVDGDQAGEVVIAIDYAIIEHFSDHLYGSPNKAVEELVTNGYDALARMCLVYVPGEEVEDRVLIWDDGESMDIAALKRLWWIARSPKTGHREATNSKVATRKLIGKFGIGKLASYSVGQRITHLCKGDDGYLLVDVDYRDLGIEAALAGEGQDASAGQPETAAASAASVAERDASLADEGAAPEYEEEAKNERPPVDPTAAGDETVSQADVPEDTEPSQPHRSPIVRLDEAAARTWVLSQFRDGVDTKVIDDMFARESWTIAAIGDLKDVDLPAGRLGWILSTGMPLRDDFQVFVNETEIKSRLATDMMAEWNLSQKQLSDALKSGWSEAKNEGHVDGEVTQAASEDGEGLSPAVHLPHLGQVQATVRFFAEALTKGKAAEHGRSYGFFIYVRGRLLNPEDPFVLLPDPSFGTFYRAQWVIHADELDSELLADRERLRRATAKSRELEVLQQALYLAARSEFDRLDQKKEYERSTASLLPVDSRESFREPFTALLLRNEQEDGGFDLSDPKVVRQLRDPAEPIALLDTGVGGFAINAAHPLFKAIRDRLGGGKKAKEALRAIDLFAIAERLLEGYLYDIGVSEDRVTGVLNWRDDLFRAMADRYRGAPDEIVAKVRATSYGGSKDFEVALAELFELMGFVATRDGASGQKDVLVVAPTGHDEVRFTVEGKGSVNAVTNDDAEISIAASHRDKVEGAFHAIVIARQFTGFERSDDPEVLKQCRATKGVSIVTVDVLADLYDAVHKFFYPLDVIVPVLAKIESPKAKAERVAELQNPVVGFDHLQLLDHAWAEQQAGAAGDVVLFRGLWQSHYKSEMSFEDFRVKLTALEALSRGLIRLTGDDRSNGTLRQSPEIIAAAIATSLGS
jgi:hypothetical protein